MEKLLLKADKRNEVGKGVARSLRRRGFLPAVVYSEGNSTLVRINSKEMTRLMSSGAGEHALITLAIHEDGSETSHLPVLIKDYQLDPVSEDLLHVDFIQVSLEENVNVTIPIVLAKEPIGVKMGGILEHHMREVEIECLPTQIPEKIEVDAEALEIGDVLHVSDLTPPPGTRITADPGELVLLVSAPKVEEAPAEALEAEAAEPELVKAKGKEEAEGETKEEKEKEK